MSVIALVGDADNFYRIDVDGQPVTKIDYTGSSRGNPIVRTTGGVTVETWNEGDDLHVDLYVNTTMDNLPFTSIENVTPSFDIMSTRHIICSITVNMANLDPRQSHRHQIILRDIF